MSYKTILYVPMIYGGDNLSFPIVSDTFYYRYQDRLWYFFESLGQEGWNIIWKALPTSSHVVDPFQFRSSEYIRYSTNKLKKEMDISSHVYLDYMSTPYLEAKLANKNVYVHNIKYTEDFFRDNLIFQTPDNENMVKWLNNEYSDPNYKLVQKNPIDWKEIVL